VHISDIQIRDPFVVQESGRYHLFGSTDTDIWKADGTGFDRYESVGSLTEFAGPFPAFRPPKDFWAQKNFWAPEVYCYAGAAYMFATFKPLSGRRGTAVLKAESVTSPFIPHSEGPVTPAEWECLDGTLFVDTGGQAWMVFCHEWQQTGDGEICALALDSDLRRAIAAPVLLFRASEAPWTGELAGRAPGSYVTDGPFLYTTACGDLVMLWSSFTKDGRYAVGLAQSQTGTVCGPWKQSAVPLPIADGGHAMLFLSLEGQLYLTFHAPNQTPLERAQFVALDEEVLRLF
jgi:hypothetical protein